VSVKVVAGDCCSVEQSIASLNLAVSTWVILTPVAVFRGVVDTTVGGGVIVVKVHT
jgi:hypothetical protein